MGLYALTEEILRRINQMWRWVHNVKFVGDGVSYNNTDSGLTVTIRQARSRASSTSPADPGVVLRITSAYSGRGWYSAAITIPPTPKEYTDNTATTYTDGSAFANGDYAKNLSDNIVYHRVAGAWANAAGHITSSDADTGTDLTTQKTTFLATGPAAGVIACNLFEATTGNDAALVSPIAADELCLGMYWSTQSNGTDVYVITGRFRMKDGSNYMVPEYNAGQWTVDYVRAHT